MTYSATIILSNRTLALRWAAGDIREDRMLDEADAQRFEKWRTRHQELARARKLASHALLQLGEQLYEWLNGPEQFLRRILESAVAPLLIEFTVAKQDNSALSRAFLDAPWELLASEGRHWALSEDIAFCPLRRIGSELPVLAPSPYRLNLVFMAAAPRGADTLNYEAEESAILRATQNIELDLVVEESGTVDLLGACVAREHPDAVQISCHGTLRPEPALLLEDEVGDKVSVKSNELVRKLAAHQPRLLFLSACETAQADSVLDSLARTLVRAGIAAVLGWAAPVLDAEATAFAAHLYARLTQGEILARAVAYARLDLSQARELAVAANVGTQDWHLARLYLGPQGGGALASADGPRKKIGRGQALRAFLDAKGKQIPVASEHEFVGRRRELQAILRAFRTVRTKRPAGVLIHGLGYQGKSSLAARIAQRLEPTHELVVLYGRYNAVALLNIVRERLGTPEVSEICKRYLPLVERDPSQLLPALTELLEGPCQQRRQQGDKLVACPLLLVIDDFEQALESRSEGLHLVNPESIEFTRAVLQAFNTAATDSLLLLTSRYRFTLPQGPVDLARRLQDIPLHRMDLYEARKQASAKLRETPSSHSQVAALNERLERILLAAQGNPGLQELLFSICLHDPDSCDLCLNAMDAYRECGASPHEEQVRSFLESLAIEKMLALLSTTEHDLLQASTLFELPVPLTVMRTLLNKQLEESAFERLTALGLWEVFEEGQQHEATARVVNALVRPKVGSLCESEYQCLAKRALPVLFACWGGKQTQKTNLQDYELTRLALIAGDEQLLADSTAGALRHLLDRFEYRRAEHLAQQVLDRLAADDIDQVLYNTLLTLRVTALMYAADYPEAERALLEVFKIEDVTLGPDNCSPIPVLQSLTTLYEARGMYDMAEQYAKLLEINDCSIESQDKDFAKSLYIFGLICEAQGKYKKGFDYVSRSLEIQEKILGQNDKEVAITLNLMAKLYTHLGQYEKASSLFMRAIGIWSLISGSTHREVALLYNNIGMLCYQVGEYQVAETYLNIALEFWEKIYGAEGHHPEMAETISNRGLIYLQKNQPDDAEPLFQRALELWESSCGSNHPYIGTAWNNLGLVYLLRKQFQCAGKLFLKAVKLWQGVLGPENEKIATALNNLAESFYLQGMSEDAIKYGERALVMQEQTLGLYHPDLLGPLSNLERYFTYKEQYEKAGLCRSRIEMIRTTLQNPNG